MRTLFRSILVLLLPLAATAHVNSPDVYFDGYAGPYHLLVTLRPPTVVPGVAQVLVRSVGNDVDQIKILPLRMIGPGSKNAPIADVAKRSTDDPQLFTGSLWIMVRGSWKVEVQASGQKGAAQLDVPLPAVSASAQPMQAGLGILLAVLGLALAAGLIGIIVAALRDAGLPSDQAPTPVQKKRGMIGLGVAAALVLAAFVFGDLWWGGEASANARLNYKIPQMQPSLSGDLLHLQLENPNESEPTRFRSEQPDRIRLDDLIPDHGHIMHLFVVRMPDMKAFWHLHPDQVQTGDFAVNLPIMPEGQYKLYADIVHHTGFPETHVATINLPALAGETMTGDNAGSAELVPTDKVAQLSDGYRMVWERDVPTGPNGERRVLPKLKANQPYWFRFRVEDKDGKPATDLEPYMGMAGHAVFISTDGSVFAHVHPAGSVSMAAVNLAEGESSNIGMEKMAGMDHSSSGAEVSFPYGFPKPGEYRIFVQVKRAGKVETAEFTAKAE
ncbi:MAG TPA: hypothetical protein VJW20_16185 [Candidatus Angelobacter sp.]|nr:hypothetical protein [Candidatus Angelobacter sp.]